MKKNDVNIKDRVLLKLILLLLPFLLGIIGFKLECVDYSYLDAAYASMQMYFANIPIDWEYNLYIEIGRWLAPFCGIFLGIGLVMELVRGLLWPRIWSKFPSHYVVYGDTVWTNLLCKEKDNIFSKYCVLDRDKFVNSSRYVLLFDSDKENLDFYTSFLLPKTKNKNVKIFMNLLELEPQDIQMEKLSTFQINNFIAISFFKASSWIEFERRLIEQKGEGSVKIGIVGFGDLGKRMLQSALVMNIISDKQKIEYHIWGDTLSYQKKHTCLNEENLRPDKLIFHGEDINASLRFLEDFDVIFMCGKQEENLPFLSDLLRLTGFVGKGGRVYANVENEEVLEMFQVAHNGVKRKVTETEKTFLINERLFPITIPNKEDFLDKVIQNKLTVYKKAEKKHEAYIDNARKREVQEGVSEYEYFNWKELNSYLRWENVSSTNYDEIGLLLREKGVPEEALAEFEHIRWLRCHYLDNWEYSPQRDDSAHQHPDLKEFQQLSEEEKGKDYNLILDGNE